MQRGVLVPARGAKALEMRANARWLIDRELFDHCEMQRQVQERIDCSGFRRVVAIQMALGVLEQRVVLRVKRDQFDSRLFQAFERGTASKLRPSIDEKATGFVAARREHDQTAGFFGLVLCGNAQRSRIAHSGHLGTRAMQV